ncbi:cyclic GMP-AMP synthase isoform X2 [Cricetulus griseus]|uniref:Cyclic GMP-AMP synthase isoform X2 n=1 Tax=Cricetulus griseus TaxID=10029 RepID=A0A9J7FRW3_CRIGR|nr:cyclic GMP-AMP synthase isoform X2 [Cricetulus griseus]XP_027292931.1 cyclic GMP-AMP synthase isoform X2 [Cricetulus griseus]
MSGFQSSDSAGPRECLRKFASPGPSIFLAATRDLRSFPKVDSSFAERRDSAVEGQFGRPTASLSQKPAETRATMELNRTVAAPSHAGSCDPQKGAHSRCAERVGEPTDKSGARARQGWASVCTKDLQYLATGAAGEAELPTVPENPPPAISDRQLPWVPELQSPAIPDPQLPGVSEPQPPAIPDPQLPRVPEPRSPAIPGTQLPGVPEPKPPAIPDPQLPSVREPQSPAIPDPQLPWVPEPQSPAIPGTQLPGVSDPQPPATPDPQLPRVQEPQPPAILDPKVPGILEPKPPAIPGTKLPGVPEPKPPAIPDPQLPWVPEPQSPAIPGTQLPGVSEPQPPAIPDPNPPGVLEPQSPGIPDPQLPGVSESPLPAIPDSQLLELIEPQMLAITDSELSANSEAPVVTSSPSRRRGARSVGQPGAPRGSRRKQEETPDKKLKKALENLKLKREEISSAATVVNGVVGQLLSRMKNSESEFKGVRRLNSGSYYERVKISAPNEFDVMFKLKVPRIQLQECYHNGVFYLVKLRNIPRGNPLGHFLEDEILSASKMLSKFREIIKEEVEKIKDRDVSVEEEKPGSPAVTLLIRNPEEISVDIILALESKGSWPVSTKEGLPIKNWLGTKVSNNRIGKSFYLVPKSAKVGDGFQGETWRLSFSHIEKYLLKNHGKEKTCCKSTGVKCCRVSLYRPSCSGTHFVDQAGIEHRELSPRRPGIKGRLISWLLEL